MPLRTLYVNRQGAVLGIRNEALIVRSMGEILDVVPMASLQSVVLFGNIQVSTQAMHKLLSMGIDLIFLSQKGKWRGRLVGPKPRNVFLLLAQYEATKNIEFRLEWAKNIVFTKILAEQMAAKWLDDSRDVWEWEFTLQHMQPGGMVFQTFEQGIHHRDEDHLPEKIKWATTMQEIMGIEGIEAQKYFSQWDRWLTGSGFEFGHRSRRPAKNPVNALLNLGYMMMLSEVERALLIHGFEPMLGLMHGVSYGRNSLALDVLELFRTFPIETLVLKLIKSETITPYHFDTHSSGEVRLSDSGWALWLKAYEENLQAYRPYILKVMSMLRSQILINP